MCHCCDADECLACNQSQSAVQVVEATTSGLAGPFGLGYLVGLDSRLHKDVLVHLMSNAEDGLGCFCRPPARLRLPSSISTSSRKQPRQALHLVKLAD